jgi:hypothetical protein
VLINKVTKVISFNLKLVGTGHIQFKLLTSINKIYSVEIEFSLCGLYNSFKAVAVE